MVDTAKVSKDTNFLLNIMVAGFPTAGGFPGYLRKGIKNITECIINDKKIAFFLSLENGRDLRIKTYTIPKREA